MSSLSCKNCGTQFQGNFCPQCGQSSHTEKIDAAYFLHDIPHSIFHLDKGFFYTLKKLLINPGFALRDYLEGKRVQHFRPFAFVVLMSTICTLLIKGVHYLMNLRYKPLHGGQPINFGDSLFVKYPSILIFLLIPVLSLITWLFFRKRRYNYWEHFLVNTYLAAWLNVFLLIISLVQLCMLYISGSYGINFILFMFFFMSYYGHAFGGLMTGTGKLATNIVIMVCMNFFLASVYITAFVYSGIMTSWWGK